MLNVITEDGRIGKADDVGKITVPVRIANVSDLSAVASGKLDVSEIREVSVPDAVIDTGASKISMPVELIERLELTRLKDVSVRTAAGKRRTGYYGWAHATVFDRFCVSEVVELPSGSPVLIGAIPLQAMDWFIDMKNECLTGNPEHGGEWMDEVFTLWD